MLHYLETHSTDPFYNLAFEEYVLEHRREGDWLMLWQNEPTVVIGLNQLAAAEVDANCAERLGIHVVRRATGGGAVYHDAGNLNYSLMSDAGEPGSISMSRFTGPVCRALRTLGVPAEATGRNDITVDGLKVSGTAQRLSGSRILHHGTLLFKTDVTTMSAVLRPDTRKFESKAAKSVRSRVGQISDFMPEDTTFDDFTNALLDALAVDGLAREQLSADELYEVEALADSKYRTWDWTWGRTPDFNFNNSRRFPGGSLSVSLNVSKGMIREAVISGDFMALLPCDELCRAMCGRRFERDEVSEALIGLDLESMLGGITEDELLSLLFD